MSLYHEIDATQPDVVSVTTYGSQGQQLARTTHRDLPSALEYARRQAAWVGGDLLLAGRGKTVTPALVALVNALAQPVSEGEALLASALEADFAASYGIPVQAQVSS